MFAVNKNSYLHNYHKAVNPRLLNRCVQKAWDFINVDESDLDPPFNRLTSEQPSVLLQEVHLAVTHRKLGFGRFALPKLRRELHDKNPDVVLAAIESLSDLVHDPQRAYEAIDLNIIDRMVDLLDHKEPIIREMVCRTLTTLAGFSAGREAIVSNKCLLANIAGVLEDQHLKTKIQASAVLEMVARFWKTADELLDCGFVQIILSHLLSEPHIVIGYHLQTLHSIMYGPPGKKAVIGADGFNIFMKLLDEPNANIIARSLMCLADIAASCEGEKIAREGHLLKVANGFLKYSNQEVVTYATLVIMFCTVKTPQQMIASKIPKLIHHLVTLCKNNFNERSQMFAIKALTNICHNPEARNVVKVKYLSEIKNVKVPDAPHWKEMKKSLLDLISWESYHSL